jgi:hypothetical protein
MLNGLATNLAVPNKWIALIPLSLLAKDHAQAKKFNDIELKLTEFSIPQVELGSTTASFKGVTIKLPTKVINPENREIQFSYLIDANWLNYRLLYYWASGIGIINPTDESSGDIGTGIYASSMIPVHVYLLDSFLKKIIEFKFNNCWISLFSDLLLDCQQPDDKIKHTFTLNYTDYEILDV